MSDGEKARKLPATLIPGDGIGPEIIEAVIRVLDVLGQPFAWDIQQAGLASLKENGDLLPEDTLDSIRRTGLALKGPLTTPVGDGFRSVNVRLRETFQLYANAAEKVIGTCAVLLERITRKTLPATNFAVF